MKAVLFSFGPTTNRLLLLYISRVSVPISPRQQCHLAFTGISEFNLQPLYLPGLKNVVSDFLSRPLPESTKTVIAMAAAHQVNFEEMTAEQNHFAEMQHLLGSSSLKLAFPQTGTQRLAGDVSTGVFHPIVPPNISTHPHPSTTFFSPSC